MQLREASRLSSFSARFFDTALYSVSPSLDQGYAFEGFADVTIRLREEVAFQPFQRRMVSERVWEELAF